MSCVYNSKPYIYLKYKKCYVNGGGYIYNKLSYDYNFIKGVKNQILH